MSNRAILLVLVGSLLALAVGLYTQIVITRSEVDTGWSMEAHLNPLLAAELFLQNVGLPVSSKTQLELGEALPEGGTVYINRLGQVMTVAQIDQLTSWMERGGHLVLSAGQDEEDNPLLQRFDVEVYSGGCDCESHSDEHTDSESVDPDSDGESADDSPQADEEEPSFSQQLREFNKSLADGEVVEGFLNDGEVAGPVEPDVHPADMATLSFEQVEGLVRFYSGTNLVLDHPSLYAEPERERGEEEEADTVPDRDDDYLPDWEYEPFYFSGTEHGLTFMQFEVGEGLMTVMAGSEFWSNGEIGFFDHAYLLQILATDDAETILLYGLESPNFLQFIWRRAPDVIVALLLLLFAWLWSKSTRLGPIIEPTDLQTRGLDEHLLNSGLYHWRVGRKQQLLKPLIAAIEYDAARHNPHYRELDKAGRVRLLSQHSGRSEQEVLHTIYGPPPASREEFTHRVQQLNLLRKKL